MRAMFWCICGGLAATLTIRVISKQPRLSAARLSFFAVYALLGAAGLYAGNIWHKPLEAGLWAGLFVVFILDGPLGRLVARKKL